MVRFTLRPGRMDPTADTDANTYCRPTRSRGRRRDSQQRLENTHITAERSGSPHVSSNFESFPWRLLRQISLYIPCIPSLAICSADRRLKYLATLTTVNRRLSQGRKGPAENEAQTRLTLSYPRPKHHYAPQVHERYVNTFITTRPDRATCSHVSRPLL